MKAKIFERKSDNSCGKFKTKEITLNLVAENLFEELAIEYIIYNNIKIKVIQDNNGKGG